MDENMQDGSDVLEGIAFVGETLGPFFLQDPKTGEAGAAFQALAALDVDAAAAEWPFAGEAEARACLALMKEGLAHGIEDDDLVWEYRRLFVGPAPKPAPPWGSVSVSYTHLDVYKRQGQRGPRPRGALSQAGCDRCDQGCSLPGPGQRGGAGRARGRPRAVLRHAVLKALRSQGEFRGCVAFDAAPSARSAQAPCELP